MEVVVHGGEEKIGSIATCGDNLQGMASDRNAIDCHCFECTLHPTGMNAVECHFVGTNPKVRHRGRLYRVCIVIRGGPGFGLNA
eukprot:4090675-Amphidinium_carterae.3